MGNDLRSNHTHRSLLHWLELMKHFVWLPGLRGPEPQIWHDEQFGKVVPLFKVGFDGDLTLEQLMTKYPAPKAVE
jgi:hypothetical protein